MDAHLRGVLQEAGVRLEGVAARVLHQDLHGLLQAGQGHSRAQHQGNPVSQRQRQRGGIIELSPVKRNLTREIVIRLLYYGCEAS